MSHTTALTDIVIKDEVAIKEAVDLLRKQGVKVTLEKDAAPRLYFKDQLQRHHGRANEICDYVIRCHDSAYDIGLIKQADKSFLPVFDIFAGELHKTLGVPYTSEDIKKMVDDRNRQRGEWLSLVGEPAGKTLKDCPIPTLSAEQAIGKYSTAKFIREYVKRALVRTANRKGQTVKSVKVRPDGSAQIKIAL